MKNNPKFKFDKVLKYNQFDNFVSGANNACLIKQLKNTFPVNISYTSRVFFVAGAIGTGKTHIAQAYWNYIRQQDKSKKPYYSKATTLTGNFVEEIKSGEINSFISKLEQSSALIIDDIQYLSNKEKTQGLLIDVIECLLSSDIPVLITSSEGNIDKTCFNEKLISLIKGGFVYRLKKLNYYERLDLIKEKANELNIPIEEHLMGIIAHYFKKSDVRILIRILNSLKGLKSKNNNYDQLKATLKLFNE